MEDEVQFAVVSKRFSLYKAFREEVEKFGWKWNEKFNPFTEEKRKDMNCLFFSTHWYRDGIPMFSFSNYTNDRKVFDLDGEFEEALEYAESLVKKKVTYEDVEKSLGSPAHYVSVRVADAIAANKLLAMAQFANVAEYLNPEHVRADVLMYLDENGCLCHRTVNFSYGHPRFINASIAQMAITILGEETIKTALK